MSVTDRPHWFADIDTDWPEEPRPRWQPCLETLTGHVPCLDVWFDSREECEQWIREFVIGAPLEELPNP